MNDFERELERQYAELPIGLGAGSIRPAALQAVRGAALAEARRLRIRRRAAGLRPLAVAAALGVFAWLWPIGSRQASEVSGSGAASDPLVALDDWQAAMSASGDRVTLLFADHATESDLDKECDDLLRSFEESFDALGQGLGA